MPDGNTNRRKDVIREIWRLKHERNRGSVKAAVVAEGLDHTPKEVAPVLQDLADNGYLDRWGNSTPTTFLIDFEADSVDFDLPDVEA